MSQYSRPNSFGLVYFLFSKEVSLRAGKKHRIFFFADNPTADVGTGQPEPMLPPDKDVRETKDGKLYVVSQGSAV